MSSSITLECRPSSPVSALHGTNLYSTNLRDWPRPIYDWLLILLRLLLPLGISYRQPTAAILSELFGLRFIASARTMPRKHSSHIFAWRRPYRKHSFLHCCVTSPRMRERVYGAVAWQCVTILNLFTLDGLMSQVKINYILRLSTLSIVLCFTKKKRWWIMSKMTIILLIYHRHKI
jgi:hypothetical protein